MFWKESFLDKMRAEWLRRLVKIQYYAGGVWYDAAITKKEISGNAVKIISTTTDSTALTVTAVRIIDINGDVAGERTEHIVKKGTQSVITLWEFPLYEAEI